MTAGLILIQDPSSSKPSNDVAHDAINSEINGKVVVRVIGMSGCRVSGCRVPKVPGYNKYSKCRKQDMTENRTRLKTGVQGDIHNNVIPEAQTILSYSPVSTIIFDHTPLFASHYGTLTPPLLLP